MYKDIDNGYYVDELIDIYSILKDNGYNLNEGASPANCINFFKGKKIIFGKNFFSFNFKEDNDYPYNLDFHYCEIQPYIYSSDIEKEFKQENIIKTFLTIFKDDNIIYLRNCMFDNQEFELTSNLTFELCSFNSLLISCKNKKLNLNIFGASMINELGLINIENIGNINLFGIIDKIFINNLNMKNFFIKYSIIKELFIYDTNLTDSRFILTNCSIKKIEIENSDLGQSTFNSLITNSFYLKHVTLNNCIFNNVTLPAYLSSNGINGKSSDSLLKDNYRQLKHVMDKNGNHTEANKFFALEMEYYGKTLDIFGIKYSRFVNPLWWIHFIQLIISNYGNNYWLPIMHIFLISFWFTFFSSGYFIIDNNFQHEWLSNLLIIDKKLIENLLTIELVSYKILLGILYYQLIIALKRTTKR